MVLLHSVLPTGKCARRAAFSSCKTFSRRVCRISAQTGGQPSPEQLQAALQAMKDPKMREQMKAVQEAMKQPEMQQQMAQMAAMMQNQQLQQKMAQLKDDPEFAEVFKDIQKGGMSSLMKYWNDPGFLSKLGGKLGNIPAAGPASPPPAAATPPPEINTLLDAARWGDLEAAEDFLAIGKDINMRDAEQRAPLHLAVAYDHRELTRLLLDSSADLEACDSKANTPLHYAAGYGRVELVEALMEAGANASARNGSGKTAADLAKLNPRNPINTATELLEKLEKAATIA